MALNPQNFADVLSDIRRVGVACDCATTAEHYVNELTARIEAVRQRTSQLDPTARPRVACIEWIEPLMIAANWLPDLIALAGGMARVNGKHTPGTVGRGCPLFLPRKGAETGGNRPAGFVEKN